MKPRDLLHLVLLAALWSASFLFMRVAAPEFSPLALIELRVGIAAVFLLVVLAARGRFELLRVHRHTARRCKGMPCNEPLPSPGLSPAPFLRESDPGCHRFLEEDARRLVVPGSPFGSNLLSFAVTWGSTSESSVHEKQACDVLSQRMPGLEWRTASSGCAVRAIGCVVPCSSSK